MNWIHFLLWLTGLYIIYYLGLFLWDTVINNNPKSPNSNGHELTFSEKVEPHDAATLVADAATKQIAQQLPSTPEMIASGGVPLKDVFSLARKEAIVYLKEVSFN